MPGCDWSTLAYAGLWLAEIRHTQGPTNERPGSKSGSHIRSSWRLFTLRKRDLWQTVYILHVIVLYLFSKTNLNNHVSSSKWNVYTPVVRSVIYIYLIRKASCAVQIIYLAVENYNIYQEIGGKNTQWAVTHMSTHPVGRSHWFICEQLWANFNLMS